MKRTRQLLFGAFMELVHEKDFQAISVQDIAERATVNRATFYAHFESKFDLCDNLMREKFRQKLAAIATNESTVANLTNMCAAVFEFLSDLHNQCSCDRQFSPMLERAIYEELYEYVIAKIEEHAKRTAAKATIEASAFVTTSSIVGAGIGWIRSNRKLSAEEMAKQIVSVLTDGLPEPLGARR